MAAGSLTPGTAQLLARIIEAKLAFLISGGTGSGKTTLLAALLALVPPQERIVIVEDSKAVAQPSACRADRGRPANTELTGAISLTDLVRQSLRMRPDRLVVGEVRGAEICDLLTAMNTGHEGGCGTVHANSTADIPARLEALASLGGLPRPALHAQLAAALDAVIHVARDDSGLRRVAEISIFVREPGAGWSAASAPSSSALTATVCWVRVAGSWNGCSNVDHDHDQSWLRAGRCWRYVVPRREAFAADSLRQRLRPSWTPPQASNASAATIMAIVAILIILLGLIIAAGYRELERCSPPPVLIMVTPGWLLNTDDEDPPAEPRLTSRTRARSGLLPSGRPGAIGCAGYRRRRLRRASRGPSGTHSRRGRGQVWRQQAQRAGYRGLLELARAWQVSVETGAPMSSTLDQVATSLSADQELNRVVNSELAAARATSKVMAALPPCGIGIGYLLGGDPARWLLAGPAGWACLLSGILWRALVCCGLRLWLGAPQRTGRACLHH